MTRLAEFICSSNTATTQQELLASMLKFLNHWGVDRFLMAGIQGLSTDEKEKNFGLVANYPGAWMDHYVANHYVNNDPVYKNALNCRSSFLWDDLVKETTNKTALRVMNEAKECGLLHGASTVLHQPLGKVVGFSFVASEMEVDFAKISLSMLRTASFQFYESYRELLKIGEPSSLPTLTEREREVLVWIANGRTKSDVAEILLISEACVKRHCENLSQKLGTNTLAHAVAVAIQRNLIDPF